MSTIATSSDPALLETQEQIVEAAIDSMAMAMGDARRAIATIQRTGSYKTKYPGLSFEEYFQQRFGTRINSLAQQTQQLFLPIPDIELVSVVPAISNAKRSDLDQLPAAVVAGVAEIVDISKASRPEINAAAKFVQLKQSLESDDQTYVQISQEPRDSEFAKHAGSLAKVIEADRAFCTVEIGGDRRTIFYQDIEVTVPVPAPTLPKRSTVGELKQLLALTLSCPLPDDLRARILKAIA